MASSGTTYRFGPITREDDEIFNVGKYLHRFNGLVDDIKEEVRSKEMAKVVRETRDLKQEVEKANQDKEKAQKTSEALRAKLDQSEKEVKALTARLDNFDAGAVTIPKKSKEKDAAGTSGKQQAVVAHQDTPTPASKKTNDNALASPRAMSVTNGPDLARTVSSFATIGAMTLEQYLALPSNQFDHSPRNRGHKISKMDTNKIRSGRKVQVVKIEQVSEAEGHSSASSAATPETEKSSIQPQPALYETLSKSGALIDKPLVSELRREKDLKELDDHYQPDCRVVIITNVPTGTHIRDIIAQVRGGGILRCIVSDTLHIYGADTAIITFMAPSDAKDYVEWCATKPLTVKNKNGRDNFIFVELASGPFEGERADTFPPSRLTAMYIDQGRSRCLRIQKCPTKIVRQIFHDLRIQNASYLDTAEDIWFDNSGDLIIHFTDFSVAMQTYNALVSKAPYREVHQRVSFLTDPCTRLLNDDWSTKTAIGRHTSLVDIARRGNDRLGHWLTCYDISIDPASYVRTEPDSSSARTPIQVPELIQDRYAPLREGRARVDPPMMTWEEYATLPEEEWNRRRNREEPQEDNV